MNEGGFAVPFDKSPYAAGVEGGPALIAESLKAAFLPSDKVRVPFNVLLIKIGSELVRIDSGAGGMFGPAGGKLVAQLVAAGLKPDQISAMFISHAHDDLIGGLLDGESKQPVFKTPRTTPVSGSLNFEMGTSPDLGKRPLGAEAAKGMTAGAQGVLGAQG